MNNPLVFPNGVLAQNPNGQPPLSMGTPVLTNPAQPQPKPKPALSQQGQTGNARGSSRVPSMMPIPNPQINMGGEGLMRIGGAIVGGAGRSFTDAFQAGTDMYGQLQDQNRAGELENYKLNEARRLAEQARQDALRKAAASGAKGKKGDAEAAAKAMVSLQNAQAVLDGFDRRDGIVGWQSLFTRGWDQLTGDERENIRLKIESMKVDRVLANIAQTKGAISEKEMEIFMSDQPSWLAGENIWRKWVTDYMDALRVMNTNLANGTTVKDGAKLPSKTDTNPAPNQSTLDEADAIVNDV